MNVGNDSKTKPGFMIYHDRFAQVDKLPDDQFHWLFRAVARYSQTGETTETDNPALAVIFSIWQDMIDADGERYQARCEASKKANDARWHKGNTDVSERMRTDANECESIRTDADISEPLRTSPVYPNYQPSTIHRQPSTVNDQPSKGESATRGKPRTPAPRFSPPTVEEVRAYCKERGNQIDAQHFVDFYASKGWRVGNQPMKDWKACVRTWEQRDRGGGFSGTGKSAKPNPALQYSQREYTDEDDDDFLRRINSDLLRDAGQQ